MSSYLAHKRKGFQGGVTAFDGFGNKSRSFNGVDDYIDLNSTNPFNGKNQLTFSAWIKMDVVDFGFVAGSLASNSVSRFRVMIRDTGLIHVIWGDGSSFLVSTQDGAALQDGEWAHIAVTFNNSGNMTRYFNGIQTGTIDDLSSYGSLSVTEDMFIGARNRGTTATDIYFNGNIADVRIYDTEFSASDISDLYNGTNVTTNLVGHWIKDTDDVLDHSVNSNNGENFGSIFSPDNPSPAIEFGRASRLFDGVDDRVKLGDSLDSVFAGTGAEFTISAWIKVDFNNSQAHGIITKDNYTGSLRQFNFQVLSSGIIRVVVTNTSGSIQRRFDSVVGHIQDDVWCHVAFTYDQTQADNDKVVVYYNGSIVSTNITNNNGSNVVIDDTSADLIIGAFHNSVNDPFYFNGNIADCRIFDSTLTSTDIASLYNGTDVQTNLVGHWLTDNDDVEDKAGTNDGTNFGSTYSYDAPLPANKLIDTYASACGAYSLRELTTAWAGQPVVEVRRTLDGAYSDFTASEITDGTLATWCQGTSAFVRTWYDQSGNGIDVTQTTEASQPRIATNGVVESENGKPAINFDTTAAGFSNAGNFDYEGGVSWYAVTHTTVNTSQDRVWCDDIIGQQGFVIFYTDGSYYLNDGAGYETFNTTGETTNQQLRSFNFDESQGSYNYGFNGSSTSGSFGTWAGSIETSGTSNIGVGQAGNGGHSYQGKMQELIIYPNDQLHNKENIERNINEFYSIY